jgi:hypothetical protein
VIVAVVVEGTVDEGRCRGARVVSNRWISRDETREQTKRTHLDTSSGELQPDVLSDGGGSSVGSSLVSLLGSEPGTDTSSVSSSSPEDEKSSDSLCPSHALSNDVVHLGLDQGALNLASDLMRVQNGA